MSDVRLTPAGICRHLPVKEPAEEDHLASVPGWSVILSWARASPTRGWIERCDLRYIPRYIPRYVAGQAQSLTRTSSATTLGQAEPYGRPGQALTWWAVPFWSGTACPAPCSPSWAQWRAFLLSMPPGSPGEKSKQARSTRALRLLCVYFKSLFLPGTY
jgi:hypothetical protein